MATKARKRRTERPRMASITAAMFYSSRLGADEKSRVRASGGQLVDIPVPEAA